jgi:hypothetical protein
LNIRGLDKHAALARPHGAGDDQQQRRKFPCVRLTE